MSLQTAFAHGHADGAHACARDVVVRAVRTATAGSDLLAVTRSSSIPCLALRLDRCARAAMGRTPQRRPQKPAAALTAAAVAPRPRWRAPPRGTREEMCGSIEAMRRHGREEADSEAGAEAPGPSQLAENAFMAWRLGGRSAREVVGIGLGAGGCRS